VTSFSFPDWRAQKVAPIRFGRCERHLTPTLQCGRDDNPRLELGRAKPAPFTLFVAWYPARRSGFLRHTARSAEGCCRQALTRFAATRCVGPDRRARYQAVLAHQA
jgi:hypothetical protein